MATVTRKTIRIAILTSSANFEDDVTAAIQAECPDIEGWVIAAHFEVPARRNNMSVIFIMERTTP